MRSPSKWSISSPGCGFARHGTYARKTPVGARVARWYCRAAQRTISLIPDCLAAHLSGSLDEIESVVRAVEQGRSIESVAGQMRPEIELPGAVRWVRRRIDYTRRALAISRGLLVTALAGAMPTMREVSAKLGARVLVRLRDLLASYLADVAPPLGFAPRSRMRDRARDGPNNRWGRTTV